MAGGGGGGGAKLLLRYSRGKEGEASMVPPSESFDIPEFNLCACFSCPKFTWRRDAQATTACL